MQINLQPKLSCEKATLIPLESDDFEALYAVASDPKIWEQHPNKDRWRREVFLTFFEGAMQSGGAFKILEKATGNIIGSTRFYGHEPTDNSIHIGYTFYATEAWGKGINHAVKIMMMNYIFQYVDKVLFHIGAENIRSQIAIGRLGVTKIEEITIPYFGEAPKLNYVYAITKSAFQGT